MKTLFGAVMISSLVGFSTPGQAAPVDLLSVSLQSPFATQPAVARSSLDAATSSGAPVSLLAPRVMCGVLEPAKVCAVRRAAEQRAHEVVGGASISRRNASPMVLLIPAGLTPVRDVVCDPQMTGEECDWLKRRSVPPVPLAPTTPVPPVMPLPPAPGLGKVPPVVTVPQAATPPVAADPESVIRPPATGDMDLVKKPPQTDSQMPVIKPKANPAAIQ